MLNFKIQAADLKTAPQSDKTDSPQNRHYDLIIVGAGPAGLTTAIYTARAMYRTLILEKMGSGGQMALTHNIENYPGFPEGINGYDLSMKMEEQARRFGTQFEFATVTNVEYQDNCRQFVVQTEAGDYTAKSVLIASGVHPRKLGVPGEDKFYGRGISFCATCDGAFYKDKEVAVIGGGEAALEEALFLTRFATKVTIIHRRDEFRASKLSQERARNNPRIHFILDTVVEEVLGEDKLTGLRLLNKKTGQSSEFRVDGVFIFIGQLPNTGMVSDAVKDGEGFIIVDEKMCITRPGLFAAGDCCQRPLKQVSTAVGDGTLAAHWIELFLEGLEEEEQEHFLNDGSKPC